MPYPARAEGLVNMIKLSSETKKKKTSVIEHPKLYSQAQTYKPNTPLRPIIFSIGGATPKIALPIAKILLPFNETQSVPHALLTWAT